MTILLDDICLFAYIYLFCFLGAYSKDVVDTFLDRIRKVLISKVLISSLTVAMLLYGVSESLLEKLPYRLFTALCYTMGLISFEIVVKYSNVQELFKIIEEFRRWKGRKD